MTDYTELIEVLNAGRSWEVKAADALEQAQAHIAELEDGLIKEREICTEYIEQRNALALRVKELEGEVERKMSAGQYLIEQNTALAIQVEQMLGALEEETEAVQRLMDWCVKNVKKWDFPQYDSLDYWIEKRKAAHKALSTAPASEIIAAHDAKVIERCIGICEALHEKAKEAFGPSLYDAVKQLRALIAAPKENSNV